MKKLSHTDIHGKALMVDIGDKEIQTRIARARGHISLAAETIKLINENQLKKGDVLDCCPAGRNKCSQADPEPDSLVS